MIDYCELAVYQRGTFLYWVMYPVGLRIVTGAVDEAALNFQFGELPQELSRTTNPFPRPSRFSAMACRIHQHTVAFVTAARQGVVLPCLRLRTFEGLPGYQACSSLVLLANSYDTFP